MLERMTSNNPIARAIRIVLVFSLVFWMSFHVESFAFGIVTHDNAESHEEGTLNDITVCKVMSLTQDQLDVVLLRSAGETAEGENAQLLKLGSAGGVVQLIATPAWQISSQVSDASIADFCDWSVDNHECLDLVNEQGVVTLKGKAAGSATVKCTLKKGYEKYLSPSFAEAHKGKPFEVTINVDVLPPYVSGVELFDAKGNVLAVDQTLRLSEGERDSYEFGAKATIADGATNETIGTVSKGADAAIPGLPDGLLTGFAWSLLSPSGDEVDEALATIDENGVLHMSGTGTVVVRCSIGVGASSSTTAQVTVTSAEGDQGGESGSGGSDVDDGQGVWRPQGQLRVVADLGLTSHQTPEEPAENSGSSASGESSSGAASAPHSSGDSSASSGSSQVEDGGEAPAEPSQLIDKVYSVSDLEALGVSETMYSMYGGNGWQMVKGSGPLLSDVLRDAGIEDFSKIESITFEGRFNTTEVAWSDLTAARSNYPHAYEEVFDDATPASPMIATKSYCYSPSQLVQGDEGETGDASSSGVPAAASGSAAPSPASPRQAEGSSGEGAAADNPADPELVDNTQFRLLFGATDPPDASIEPDALRYIHTIRVNMKETPKDDAPTDPTLCVRVGYVPVPLGYTAAFSAIPNNAVGNARFGFRWQESSDGGVTWADIEGGNVQTLRVLTTNERVGHLFRVIMETDLLNDEGKRRATTSDPVAMEIGAGFTVQLAYDPPLAGDTALFRSTVYGDVDASKVIYEWQSSMDCGVTWTTISDRQGPQLALPTNPVEPSSSTPPSESSSSSGATEPEPIPIIYIRVIAQAPDGREAYSNEVPLTVHVGNDDGAASGDTPESPSSGSGSESGASGGGQSPTSEPLQGEQPAQTVTEVSHIVFEQPGIGQTPGAAASQSERPTQTNEGDAAPTPQPDSAPEIYINSDMSERISAQVEAVDEYVTSTTPGARWTEISVANPGGDSVRRVLSGNPFAPFAAPLALGMVFAGGVERFLSFRRSIEE